MLNRKSMEELQDEYESLAHKEKLLMALLKIVKQERRYAEKRAAIQAERDEAIRVFEYLRTNEFDLYLRILKDMENQSAGAKVGIV